MKRWHLIVVVIVACAVTALVARRLLVTEEERVVRTAGRLVDRIESRDAPGVCHLLADDYQDSHGLDRPAVRSLLTRSVFPALKSIRVRTSNLRVTFEGLEGQQLASVDFDVNVVARWRARGDLPPIRWQRHVRLRLRKSGDEWRVFEAQYPLPELMRPRRVDGEWRIFEAGFGVPSTASPL